MSVRRGESAPSVASRGGTLCGPAITLAPRQALPPVVVETGGNFIEKYKDGVKARKAHKEQIVLRFQRVQAEKNQLEDESKQLAAKFATESKARERKGKMVAVDHAGGRVYAVMDDAGMLWWYPNVLSWYPYRGLNVPKKHVVKRGDSSLVELTADRPESYRSAEAQHEMLCFDEGTVVSFVAYMRHELLSDQDGMIMMHVTNPCSGEKQMRYFRPIPSGWGVATGVRRLNEGP